MKLVVQRARYNFIASNALSKFELYFDSFSISEYYNEDSTIYASVFYNAKGKVHRVGKPAVIYRTGEKYFYQHGKYREVNPE